MRSAVRCVSMRRRPMRSPPGRGSTACPVRCNRPGASRKEPRIVRASSLGASRPERRLASTTVSVVSGSRTASAPSSPRISSCVATSRMRGRLPMRDTPGASSAAASTGSASFLLPAGVITPPTLRPPSTTKRSPAPICTPLSLAAFVCESRRNVAVTFTAATARSQSSSAAISFGLNPRICVPSISTKGIERPPDFFTSSAACSSSASMSLFV